MDLKTYQGNSMADALAKVKQDLGPDAVIMHTRTLKKGGLLGVGARTMVEITASKDPRARPPTQNNSGIGRQAGERRPQRYYQPPKASKPVPPPAQEGRAQRPANNRTSNRAAPSEPPENLRLLQQELGELRGMVRELLSRSNHGSSGSQVEVPEELREYYTCLIQNAVADEIAREILDKARTRLEQCRAGLHARVKKQEQGNTNRKQWAEHQQALRRLVPAVFMESVEHMLPEAGPVNLKEDGSAKFVSLIGPTGVGKTTTVAKLAAHFKLRENKKVGLITIDTYRIAAVDQLKAYAEIMNVPLKVVMTEKEMAEAVQSMQEMDLVLIDTTGRSQNDTQRLEELRGFLDVVRDTADAVAKSKNKKKTSTNNPAQESETLETHLVLSCTAHPGQMMQVAEKFSQLGVDRVVFTKLDEAVGLGVIFNVICRLKLRLSYLTTGQDVPDDIEVSHRRKIAEMILGRSGESDASAPQASTPVDHIA
jgi:flagellar biosynthesis protein FlhF